MIIASILLTILTLVIIWLIFLMGYMTWEARSDEKHTIERKIERNNK